MISNSATGVPSEKARGAGHQGQGFLSFFRKTTWQTFGIKLKHNEYVLGAQQTRAHEQPTQMPIALL
jgi:hypothetical protein